MPEKRQLAAIMFTDIEGYTSLMQKTEEKAIRTRVRHREVFNSVTGKYKGKILQYYGDGTLSIFDSAIDAVECAIEMQLEFLEEPAIPVRIGIHIGDIIFSEEEIIGDGVNVASRVESLAVSGSVIISEKVYDEIKNQEHIKTTFLKKVALKNVFKPVEIYAITNTGLIVPDRKKIEQKADPDAVFPSKKSAILKPFYHRRLAMIATAIVVVALLLFVYVRFADNTFLRNQNLEKSIAVLPLVYLAEDQSKKYIADGVLDAITGHLSNIEGLRVMPRTSVEQYRGTKKTAREIGEELDVSYLIEGNFMIVNDQVSITIQLVVARDEDHTFYNEYKRDYKDIIAVQSEVAQTIAKEVEVAISREVRDRIEKIPTQNQEAYDAYLRGRDAFFRFYSNRNSEDLDHSIQLFEEAISNDPGFALPYAWLGRAVEYRIGQKLFIDYGEDTILSLCNKALTLDPDLTDGYWIRGRYYRNTGQLQKAIQDLEKTIDLNPNHALALRYLGTTYFFGRDFIRAIKNLKAAEKLERGSELTQLYSDIGQLYVSIGEFNRGEKYYKSSLTMQPNFIEGYRNLIWAAMRQGHFESALSYAEWLHSLYPENTTTSSILAESLANLGRFDEAVAYYTKWLELSEKLGQDALFNRHRYAYTLWMNGNRDQAIEQFKIHIETCESSIRSDGLYGKTLASYDLAGIYAFLGEKNQAYVWLRKYEREGFLYGLHRYISIDPLFESLWADEEFKAIVLRQEEKLEKVRSEVLQLENTETI